MKLGSPKDVKGIARAITRFGYLRHHRAVIIEGLRRTAARNMRHLGQVYEREPRPDSAPLDSEAVSRWMERVQARTLSDQGLENTPLNRAVLPFATFCPVRAYT